MSAGGAQLGRSDSTSLAKTPAQVGGIAMPGGISWAGGVRCAVGYHAEGDAMPGGMPCQLEVQSFKYHNIQIKYFREFDLLSLTQEK